MTNINQHLMKALDYYPGDLEQTLEAVNYALSQDENCTEALGILGLIYMEQLENVPKAIEYFEEALRINVKTFTIYRHYIKALIINEDFEEAEKFIKYALKLKGVNKGMLYQRMAIMREIQQDYTASLEALKLAKIHTYDNDVMTLLESEEKRVKGKMPKKRRTSKAKKDTKPKKEDDKK